MREAGAGFYLPCPCAANRVGGGMERNVREQEKRAAEETMLCSFQNLINFEDEGKVCHVIVGLPLH